MEVDYWRVFFVVLEDITNKKWNNRWFRVAFILEKEDHFFVIFNCLK